MLLRGVFGRVTSRDWWGWKHMSETTCLLPWKWIPARPISKLVLDQANRQSESVRLAVTLAGGRCSPAAVPPHLVHFGPEAISPQRPQKPIRQNVDARYWKVSGKR